MPSPTMIVDPLVLSRRTTATLSAGVCSATTSSTPIMAPTAVGHVLPIAGDHHDSPDAGAAQAADGAGGVGSDRVDQQQRTGRYPVDADEHADRPIEPASLPSPGHPWLVAVHADPARLADCHVAPADGAADARAGTFFGAGREGRAARPRSRAARTRAAASTCGDTWSSDAASRSTSLGSRSSAVTMSRRAGRPTVRVPVLSKSRISASASRSNAPPPLTTTPRRAARDKPATIATGAARMSGHGVATTSTATARPISPDTAHAAVGDTDAHSEEREGVAVGEAHERRVVRRRRLDQPHDACVGRVIGPSCSPAGRTDHQRCTAPPRTGSPADRSTGSGSPVSALSSMTATPVRTVPSTGITSPGRTSSRSPTAT